MGLNSGFSYVYRHYGPYSADLSEQVEDDIVFGRLGSEQRRRQSDGVPYVAYHAGSPGDDEPVDKYLPRDRIQAALVEMQRHSPTILELAATMNWLIVTERRADWQTELKRRKGAKTQNGREQRALELLRTLGLPPGVGSNAPV